MNLVESWTLPQLGLVLLESGSFGAQQHAWRETSRLLHGDVAVQRNVWARSDRKVLPVLSYL